MQSTPNVKLFLGGNRHCKIIILAKIANLTLFNIVCVFRKNRLEKRSFEDVATGDFARALRSTKTSTARVQRCALLYNLLN